MGFLGENRAQERLEQACRPVMYPHEVVVLYEVAQLTGAPKRAVELLATEQALYHSPYSRFGKPTRVAYEAVWGVAWEGFDGPQGGLFQVALADGTTFAVKLKRTESHLVDFVRGRVEALVVLDRHLDRDGSDGDGVRLRYRRVTELGGYGWTALPDRSDAPTDPAWEAWVREQMMELQSEAEAAADEHQSALNNPPMYHAAWDGVGATFVSDGAGEFVCYMDDPEAQVDKARVESLLAAAWDELAVAHGRPASFAAKVDLTASPTAWTPPLPNPAP